MPPTVRNGDVDHRPLGIVLPFQGLVTAPIATQGYPFLATDAYASVLMITTMEPFRDRLNGATSGSA